MIEIRWATEQEVMAMAGEVPLNRPITDILDDWELVAMLSTPVIAFDPEHGRVRTATGSLYLLGTKGHSPAIGLLRCR